MRTSYWSVLWTNYSIVGETNMAAWLCWGSEEPTCISYLIVSGQNFQKQNLPQHKIFDQAMTTMMKPSPLNHELHTHSQPPTNPPTHTHPHIPTHTHPHTHPHPPTHIHTHPHTNPPTHQHTHPPTPTLTVCQPCTIHHEPWFDRNTSSITKYSSITPQMWHLYKRYASTSNVGNCKVTVSATSRKSCCVGIQVMLRPGSLQATRGWDYLCRSQWHEALFNQWPPTKQTLRKARTPTVRILSSLCRSHATNHPSHKSG